MGYIDSHCHLNDEHLFPKVEQVIEEARKAGVRTMLVVGWDLGSSIKAAKLAYKYSDVYAAVGFHPENIKGVPFSDLNIIKSLAREEKVVAIGEIGLDYHWCKDPKERELQKSWFVTQIKLANDLNLPISIHSRDASMDTLEILKACPINAGCVLHCYSGSVELIKEFTKVGCYFGFDGPITFKNAQNPKEAVVATPFNRLLMETDSPYLAPVPHRGEENQPAFLPFIYEQAALLRGIEISTLKEQVKNNFETLFRVKL